MAHSPTAGPIPAREPIAGLDGLRGVVLLVVALALAAFTGWVWQLDAVRAPFSPVPSTATPRF